MTGTAVSPTRRSRRVPIGAEVQASGVDFRVWAPDRRTVHVAPFSGCMAGSRIPLQPETGGYFSTFVAGVVDGDRYGYSLDGDERVFPDPASRFQPDGPHGSSQVVDPGVFTWSDSTWPGAEMAGQVLYELHVGTFTREGTWAAALGQLPYLAELGVSLLELMPVAEFSGQFGWGYDGVGLFAPTRLYGASPDDFRCFVNRAHELGLGVILDVVYNHLGPDGNYLSQFAKGYFTHRYKTEWGTPINFDGPDAGPVRELILSNAACWVREFHLDGLRLDATQAIFDDGSYGEHILTAITRVVRAAAPGRGTLLIAESEPQNASLVRPVEEGGNGLDALWNDDFHHSATVALTGRAEAYYSDHRGTPQELISATKYGYLFQGQRYAWQDQRRGTPTFGLPPSAFVTFIQNHDQIANAALGLRAHSLAAPGCYRAMTALLLLMPATPLLFQGQEWAASTPFLYFADHEPELAEIVRRGREEFLAQFPGLAQPEVRQRLADPTSPRTFERSKLNHDEREHGAHAEAFALHRDLLRLRRKDPCFAAQQPHGVDGAVLGADAFVLRFFGTAGEDRLLVINLGTDLQLERAPEPLLAPPSGRSWHMAWSSESPRYGGVGAAPPEDHEGRWRLAGMTATVLTPSRVVRDGASPDNSER